MFFSVTRYVIFGRTHTNQENLGFVLSKIQVQKTTQWYVLQHLPKLSAASRTSVNLFPRELSAFSPEVESKAEPFLPAIYNSSCFLTYRETPQ